MTKSVSNVFLLIVISLLQSLCATELAVWRPPNGATELAKDGTCVADGQPLWFVGKQAAECGDPLYGAMRWCMRREFYGEVQPPSPKAKYADAALLLLNGCLQCPTGPAVASLRLINRLGSLVSIKCGELELTLGNVSVQLLASPGGRSVRAWGTFALGGILEGRDCGWFGSDRETIFEQLELEIVHNCGRKRPMTLLVPLPSVDVDRLRGHRAQLLEWNGLSLNLAIFGAGWDQRIVDFEAVRPRAEQRLEQQNWESEPAMALTEKRLPEPPRAIPKKIVADERPPPIPKSDDHQHRFWPPAKVEGNEASGQYANEMVMVPMEPTKKEEETTLTVKALSSGGVLLLLGFMAVVGVIILMFCSKYCCQNWICRKKKRGMEKRKLTNDDDGNGTAV